jgi:tRNA(Ile2) C34 agmatinyltransferase TiaS
MTVHCRDCGNPIEQAGKYTLKCDACRKANRQRGQRLTCLKLIIKMRPRKEDKK